MTNEELNRVIMRAEDEYDALKDRVVEQSIEIERLKEKINKAIEYIKEHSYDYKIGGIAKVNGNELLEILGDKENDI